MVLPCLTGGTFSWGQGRAPWKVLQEGSSPPCEGQGFWVRNLLEPCVLVVETSATQPNHRGPSLCLLPLG